MERQVRKWIQGHWRSHPPNAHQVHHRLPVWVQSYWRMKPGETQYPTPTLPERHEPGWYRQRVKQLHRAFVNDFDNRARVERYARRDGKEVDTKTGEIIQPAPAGVRESVLAFVFGEKLPPHRRGHPIHYGQRIIRQSGYPLPHGEASRKTRKVLLALALIACALIAWRLATYTIPNFQAEEATRAALIESANARYQYYYSLTDEERNNLEWQEYYDSLSEK